jgi:nickel-dependent lactate racemase
MCIVAVVGLFSTPTVKTSLIQPRVLAGLEIQVRPRRELTVLPGVCRIGDNPVKVAKSVVLSVMPAMYEDLWTAAKGMYKMEPAVADGGEVIIYAPHIDEVSYSHGDLIDEIGYHCRDYFLKQWRRFCGYPGGVLAHSTHVKGLGTYDAQTGVETPRITVTLATGIPRERCRRINLGYRDPATIDLAEWEGREAEGILVVPRAGEMLYRLRKGGGGAGP